MALKTLFDINFLDSGKMWSPIFAAVILQCENPLHHSSEALKSSLAQNWNTGRVTVKFWSQDMQYLQRYPENFFLHLAAAVSLLEADNTSPVCLDIFEIWPVLMAFTWKNNSTLPAAFWDKLLIFHLGQTEQQQVPQHFDCARSNGSLFAPQVAFISFTSYGAD